MTPLQKNQKVFGLGLSKTGTSTLTEALNILGVRTIHYPHDARTFAELKHGDYRLSVLQDYQGVTDTPVAPYYAQFDRAWPESKFIMTVRDKKTWLRSAATHWLILKVTGRNAGDQAFQTFTDFVSAAVYGCIYFNAERFSYAYDMHLRNVQEYFADRPNDLLVLDICGGTAGWPQLCGFLDVPVPQNVPFPHAYRTDWGTAEQAKQALLSIAPNGDAVIVIDHDGLRNYLAASRRVLPFVERGGRYWGLPEDDADAVRELEHQRMYAGAKFLALTLSSLWFLEKFSGFADYVRSRYPCVLSNELLVVFDLRD
jgi:hypothetical protein